jgi:hypothetical protein
MYDAVDPREAEARRAGAAGEWPKVIRFLRQRGWISVPVDPLEVFCDVFQLGGTLAVNLKSGAVHIVPPPNWKDCIYSTECGAVRNDVDGTKFCPTRDDILHVVSPKQVNGAQTLREWGKQLEVRLYPCSRCRDKASNLWSLEHYHWGHLLKHLKPRVFPLEPAPALKPAGEGRRVSE